MPKTFLEAMQLVQRLNIQYLWIDTLCIVQDDSEDWEREAAGMGTIYSNAFITICATAGSDCNAGLWQAIMPSWFSTDGQFVIRFYMYHSRVEEGPLASRSWAFQEQFLSRRVLHFTKLQLLWECLCSFGSEDGIMNQA